MFSLALCFSVVGDELWKRVEKEPSGAAFNSLIQLEIEKGIPRKPFINSGNLVVADILLSKLENPEERFISFVRSLAQNNEIDYCMRVAYSEREKSYLNAAISIL